MGNLSITEKIESIDKTISKLRAEKKKLVEEQIKSAKDFEEKFEHWYIRCDHKEDLDYIPNKEKYPLLRAWINNCDFNRHQTIVLEEYMEDDFALIHDKKFRDEQLEKGWTTKEDLEKLYALAGEIMDTNIGSFTIDW